MNTTTKTAPFEDLGAGRQALVVVATLLSIVFTPWRVVTIK